MRHQYLFSILMVVIFGVPLPLQAVTVKPCPTNKIAPHMRVTSWELNQGRTFGAVIGLLAPDQQDTPPSSLQEPQVDDPDDCGDIEDYDENDIGSLTSPQRRQGADSRLLFGGLHHPQPPNYGPHPHPARPQAPGYPSTRPPYWSGGYFGNNPYRPPSQQHPSNNVKPVHEGEFETQATYRPDVVGGPLGHVVGVTQARPTRRPLFDTTTQRVPNNYPARPPQNQVNYPARPPQNQINFPSRPTPDYDNYPSRPPQNQVNYPTRPPQNQVNYPTRPPQNQVNYPTRPPQNYDDYPSRPPQNQVNYPMRPTQAPGFANRRPKPRNLSYSTSVLGSFVDLLFK